MMKNVLVIFLLVLIYSCSKEDHSIGQYDLEVDKNVKLGIGKCLEIVDKDYEICLLSINDSRCPSGGKCVWEGDAVVELNLKTNSKNQSFSLHTHPNFQKDTVINNLKIELLNVFPYPDLNTAVDQKDSYAELIISEE